MAADLKLYVDKFLLNPSAPLNIIDEDGYQDEAPVIASKVVGQEGVDGTFAKATKLRIKNLTPFGEKDPRYKGKKIKRKALKEDNSNSYDQELSKYFLLEDDGELSDRDSTTGSEKEEANTDKDSIMMLGDEDEQHDSEEDEDEQHDSEEDEDEQHDSEDDEDGSDADDSELDENNTDFQSDGDTGIESEQDEEINSVATENKIITFSKDNVNEVEKGVAVKNQYAIFDALFEARIGMQKIASLSNQLPQHDTYSLFLKEDYPHFKSNLQNARKMVKKLVGDLLNLQESLLNQSSETKKILDEQSDCAESSEEEIASTEDKPHPSNSKDKKRKRRLVEEYGEIINKRHKAMIPYRDDVLNKWHSKTSLLGNSRKGSKFSNFETSPIQQIKDILANKSQLIERTQLRSLSRGNIYSILGKSDEMNDDASGDIHDPEIFDDSDFYSRMLEEVLKSKMSLSDDMTDVTQKWLQIQNLRKKSHKKVDRKASKGRKVRFDVMSKIQQFSAPCHQSLMDDTAINMLYTSGFGNSSKMGDASR